ncbi:hypothetical protein [Pelagibius sp. Alg239-R121]|uniref:hypothetical protein n=1 Tax=Pelagibius sp. Alg239-R121 TaxID=2993448 RepID=UPI0024A72A1F|nr:hypothetical protein [Pelagibius sp. Alg239-R121]
MTINLIANDENAGWRNWSGGRGTFTVAGAFGGAAVKLQYLGPDGATALDVGGDVTLGAPGLANFELGAGRIRAEVTGGTPGGLYARVSRIP